MLDAKELLLDELRDVPEPVLGEVMDFVRFLKAKKVQENLETALLSEPALKRDWRRSEEDEAWRDL